MGIQKHRRPTIAPGTDGIYADVAGGAGGVSDSLTEQDTGLTDLDGDAIYVKTLTLASIAGGLENIAHGVTGLKRLHSVEGSFLASGWWSPLPYTSGSANISIQIDVDATNLRIVPGSFFTAGTITVMRFHMRYTKS